MSDDQRAHSEGDRNGPRWAWPPVDMVAQNLERMATTAMVDAMAMSGSARTLAKLVREFGDKLGALLPPSDDKQRCQNKLSRLATSLALVGDADIPQDAEVAGEVAASAAFARRALEQLGPIVECAEDREILQPARLCALRALTKLSAFDIDVLSPPRRLARGTRDDVTAPYRRRRAATSVS